MIAERGAGRGAEAVTIPFFGYFLEAEGGEGLLCRREGVLEHGDAVEAADGVFCVDVGVTGRRDVGCVCGGDELDFMPSGSASVRTSSLKRVPVCSTRTPFPVRRCCQ